MASDQQIQANRRNAQDSTGPLTPQGKAASSLNALRHGYYARSVLLPGEDQAEFDDLCNSQQACWQPQGQAELDLVEEMVASKWIKIRLTRFARTLDRLNLDPSRQLVEFDRLDRYLNRVQNRYLRAQKELRSLRRDRPPKPLQPTPAPADAEPEPTRISPGLPALELESIDPAAVVPASTSRVSSGNTMRAGT